MPDTGDLARRIKDENLLWLLAMWALAIGAGIRDQVTFIAVLVIGAALVVVRLLKTEQGLPLTLTFPEAQTIVLERCRYELRSQENVLKSEGELAFSFDLDSWVCFLPRNIATTDIIRLYLSERGGQAWETGPFRPLSGSKAARKLQ